MRNPSRVPISRPAALCAVLCLFATSNVFAQPADSSSSYKVGPKDLIEVRVFEAPEVNGSYRVNEQGVLQLPLVGDVAVDGLAEQDIEQKISSLLEARFLNNKATVDVELKEFRSKPISVIGAVKSPGALKFSGRWTLLEALTEAGGLADSAGDTIYVLRKSPNGLMDQLEISAEALFSRADRRVNIPLFANDLISIPAKVQVTVYCMGEVASPGAIIFTSNERISLLAAIARAGGLTEKASKNRILVKRQRQGGGEEELRVSYRKILSGSAPDVELRAGDVIVVQEAFF
jgi:polysaccharide export outer membrane protein